MWLSDKQTTNRESYLHNQAYLARILFTDASTLTYLNTRAGLIIVSVESIFFSFLLDKSNTYFPSFRETSETFLAQQSWAASLGDCWVSCSCLLAIHCLFPCLVFTSEPNTGLHETGTFFLVLYDVHALFDPLVANHTLFFDFFVMFFMLVRFWRHAELHVEDLLVLKWILYHIMKILRAVLQVSTQDSTYCAYYTYNVLDSTSAEELSSKENVTSNCFSSTTQN